MSAPPPLAPGDHMVLQTARRDRADPTRFQIRVSYSAKEQHTFWVSVKGWHDFHVHHRKTFGYVVRGKLRPASVLAEKRVRYAVEGWMNKARRDLMSLEDRLRNKAPKEELLKFTTAAREALAQVAGAIEARKE